jgi:Uma2 family endonuclease
VADDDEPLGHPSVADLEAMPEDDLYELIRGELVPMSPIGRPHGALHFNVGGPLCDHVERQRLGNVYGGEVGGILHREPDTVPAPDIAFVRGEPVPLMDEEGGYIPSVPDLVIEIAAPSDCRRSLRRKVALYQEAGVPNVRLIEYCSRTVSAFPLGGSEQVLTVADVLDGGDEVPGFRLPVADIFRSPLR